MCGTIQTDNFNISEPKGGQPLKQTINHLSLKNVSICGGCSFESDQEEEILAVLLFKSSYANFFVF